MTVAHLWLCEHVFACGVRMTEADGEKWHMRGLYVLNDIGGRIEHMMAVDVLMPCPRDDLNDTSLLKVSHSIHVRTIYKGLLVAGAMRRHEGSRDANRRQARRRSYRGAEAPT